jgi:hypothetical protein
MRVNREALRATQSAALIEQQLHSSVFVGHYQRMVEVFNHEELEARFGHWPSFHDAEIQAVRLDSGQQNDEGPSLGLDVHVFDVEPSVEGGGLNFVSHSLVTMRFDGVEAVELDGFGPQNVLDHLVVKDLGPAALDGVERAPVRFADGSTVTAPVKPRTHPRR